MNIDRIAPTKRPKATPAQYQKWQNLLFLHWRVPVAMLRPLIPSGLEIDTFEGSAFVGLVPFTMRGVRPVWSPSVPGISNFHETNVRTYVHFQGRDPGVWFFSLDAASRLAVWLARTFWQLPYHFSRMALSHQTDRTIRYKTERCYPGPIPAVGNFHYRPAGTSSAAIPGSLEHFLAERYVLYTESAQNELLLGRVHHSPYPLQTAELFEWNETLLSAAGIERPEQTPLAHFASGVEVDVFPLQRVAAISQDPPRPPS